MDLRLRFSDAHRRIDSLQTSLTRLITAQITGARARLTPLDAQLRQLSPLAILDRGYALVHTRDGVLVKDAAQAPPGTGLNVQLARGRVSATVDPDEPR
jgi:exodeoxyribonuclease VII large subunit